MVQTAKSSLALNSFALLNMHLRNHLQNNPKNKHLKKWNRESANFAVLTNKEFFKGIRAKIQFTLILIEENDDDFTNDTKILCYQTSRLFMFFNFIQPSSGSTETTGFRSPLV